MEKEDVREVVKAAVRETLLSIGLATDDNESIISLQQDMAWLRKQRQSTEKIADWIRKGMITSAVSGILWLVYEGAKLAFKS